MRVTPIGRLDNFVNFNFGKAGDKITWILTYSPVDNTNNNYDHYQKDYDTEISSMKNLQSFVASNNCG